MLLKPNIAKKAYNPYFPLSPFKKKNRSRGKGGGVFNPITTLAILNYILGLSQSNTTDWFNLKIEPQENKQICSSMFTLEKRSTKKVFGSKDFYHMHFTLTLKLRLGKTHITKVVFFSGRTTKVRVPPP